MFSRIELELLVISLRTGIDRACGFERLSDSALMVAMQDFRISKSSIERFRNELGWSYSPSEAVYSPAASHQADRSIAACTR